MHFSWTVDAGEVITLLVLLCTLSYKTGWTQRAIEGLGKSLEALKSDFDAHQQQDVERFEGVNRNLVQISTSINKD